MASTTQRESAAEDYVDFDEYISFQIERTRSNVRLTDVLTAGVGAAAMGVLYLLAFVVLDHWAIPGGLPQAARTSMLLLLVVSTIGWLAWKLAFPYMRHVNALFAARLIEKSHPELKSNLLNLVDLEQSGREVPDDIRRAIEKRAALTLSHVDVDQSVDRRLLMRLSYALFIAVVLFCLYTVLSPKKPWSSIWRALAPATEVAVSTRTEILRVTPEDTEVLARSQLEVLVDLRGEIPEKTFLYYTTVDNKFVDEPIEMRLVDDATKQFRAMVTGENGRGLLQSMTYRIEAGDARTRDYRVTVIQPPSATVESLHYEFPAYMEMSPATVPGGNLDSWEGATVTLSGRANTPVRSATLRFSDTEDINTRAEEVTGRIAEETKISAKWKLTMRSDGTHPHFYHVQCRNEKGESDPEPILYSVRIRADQPPDVALVSPKGDLERPANAIIPLVIDARDPDFKLRRINLRIEKDGEELIGPAVFEGNQQSHQGSFDWNLGAMSLKTGDTISYWIEAQDNKQPIANRKNSPKLRIRITDPVSRTEVLKQLAEEKKLLDAEQQANKPDEGNPANQDEKNADAGENPRKDEKNAAAREADDRNSEPQKNGDEKPNPQDAAGEKVADDQKEPKEGEGTKAGEQGERQQPFDPESAEDVGEVLDKIVQRQKEQEQENPNSGDEQNSKKIDVGNQAKSGAEGADEKSEKKDPQSAEQKGEEPGASKENRKQGSKPNDAGEKNDSAREGAQPSKDPKSDSPGQSEEKSNDPSDGKSGSENSKPEDQDGKGAKDAPKRDPEKKPEGQPSADENDAKDDQAKQGDAPADKNGDDKKTPQEPNEKNEKQGNAQTTKPAADRDPREKDDADPKSEQGKQNGDKEKQPGENDANAKSEPKSDQQSGESKQDDSKQKNGGGADEKSDDAPMNADKSNASQKNPKDGEDSQQEKSNNAKSQNPKESANKSDADKQGIQSPSDDAAKDDQQKSQGADKQSDSKEASRSSEKTPSKNAQPADPQRDSAKAKNKPDQEKEKRPARADLKRDDESPQENQTPPSDNNAKTDPKRKDPRDAQPRAAKNDPAKDPEDQKKAAGKQSREQTEDEKNAPNSDAEKNPQKGRDGSKQNQDAPSKEGEPGSDSEKSSDETGKKQAGKPSDKPTGKAQQKSSQSGQQGGDQGESGEGKGEPSEKSTSGQQTGGKVGKGGMGDKDAQEGVEGNDDNGMAEDKGTKGKGEGETPPEAHADEADLEAAKKATNLVLRKLEDDLKRGEVDPKLLEELGWTKEQMQKFTEQLKKQLNAPELDDSAAARARQRQFEETLKSLNFRAKGTRRSGADVKKRATDEVGPRRTPPPAEYREYYEAFTRSLSKQGTKAAPKTNDAETPKK